jgi:hypothetical protein
LAIESANQSTRESSEKEISFPVDSLGQSRNRDIRDVIYDLNKFDIETHGGMMMGNPKTESVSELMNNVRLCQELMESGMSRVALWPYMMFPGASMSTDENFMEGFARMRREFGNVGYGMDITNMDSLAQGWTAEELITVVQWANKAFSSGEGKNWGTGKSIGQEELEAQIETISDPEILYKMTALRLLREGGVELLELYHEAIKANDKLRELRQIETPDLLPEYALRFDEKLELTECERGTAIETTRILTEEYVETLNESDEAEYTAVYDYRAESARDQAEFIGRSPVIEVNNKINNA